MEAGGCSDLSVLGHPKSIEKWISICNFYMSEEKKNSRYVIATLIFMALPFCLKFNIVDVSV